MTVTVGAIKRHVAAAFNVPMDVMDGRQLGTAIVRPRQVAMYLCATMTQHSLPEIGLMFGGRDHTTVIHAVRRIREFLENDFEFARRILAIKIKLPHGRGANGGKVVKTAATISPYAKLAGEGKTNAGGIVQLLVSPRGKWTLIEITGNTSRMIACGRGWSVPDAPALHEADPTPKKPRSGEAWRDISGNGNHAYPNAARGGAGLRTCLKCGKQFPSTGCGNRRCRPCAKELYAERTGT
ncbi:MAG: hypothetical protein COA65_09005 [Rhodospirillaceae bacterium]|nr:MAG: hypothetical protein COA65_09005 [Rhodospirillaceae bacterium]